MRLILKILVVCVSLSACDPFAGLAVAEEFAVPQNDVAGIQLFVRGRHLPASARNVRMRIAHFQDTALYVRFDADIDEVRRFAEQVTYEPVQRGGYIGLTPGGDLSWWISEDEARRAEHAADDTYDGDGMPPIRIAFIEDGPQATVWMVASNHWMSPDDEVPLFRRQPAGQGRE